MAKKPKLTLVNATPPDLTAPPANLGEAGASLWRAVMAEYQIGDTGGLALLGQACAAVDRLAEYAEIIKRDGMLVHTARGPKEHPLLRHELSARSFVCRTLTRLGLSVESIKPVGRPGQFTAWTP